MPRYPIPNDWDGLDWGCFIVEWPNSVQWLGILRGYMTTAQRGRFWDERTGSIIDTQAIGLEIAKRNPVSACDDIVTQLAAIAAAVESLDVNSTAQLTIQTNIQNNIDVVATAVADSLAAQSVLLVAASNASASSVSNSFAWSQSMAQNLLAVKVINNVEQQFRPIEVGVDAPPEAGEATPTGITSATESTTPSEICKRVYWLVINVRQAFNYMKAIRGATADTALGIMGFVADSLGDAASKDGSMIRRWLLPAASLLNFAHEAVELYKDELDPFSNLSDWMDENYEEIVCMLSDGVERVYPTRQLQEIIVSDAEGWGMPTKIASMALLLFNFSSLAALYYVAPLLDVAPAIPTSERANICTFCLE